MKGILSIVTLFACAFSALAGDPAAEARVRVALALASAAKLDVQPVSEPVPPPAVKPQSILDYVAARAEAIRTNKPLVCFVRQPSQAIDGCVICSVEILFPEVGLAGVVVAFSDGHGDLDRVKDFSGSPSVADIRAAIAEKMKSRKQSQAGTPAEGTVELTNWKPTAFASGCANGSCGAATAFYPVTTTWAVPSYTYAIPAVSSMTYSYAAVACTLADSGTADAAATSQRTGLFKGRLRALLGKLLHPFKALRCGGAGGCGG